MAGGPNVGGGKRGAAVQTVGVLNLLTDVAFNLLIFFVVCASTKPEKARPQQMPSANKDKNTESTKQNLEVNLSRTDIKLNGAKVESATALVEELKKLPQWKGTVEDRIVVLRSDKDTPYSVWIQVTGEIEEAGGTITLLLDEEQEVRVK
jgi:biopolymer transport protein ExbD